MITTDDIKKVAKLSRLEFSDSEIEEFKEDLNKIVEYVTVVQKVDTSQVKREFNYVDAQTGLREDVPNNTLSVEQALQNAPQAIDNGFGVPTVIE